jgi:hypothetical protein
MAKLTIRQGATFNSVIRVETDQLSYKAITGITQTAPVVITVVGHGLSTGWRAAVVSALGMRQINADNSAPLQDSDYRAVTVLGADSISINEINASGFNLYLSGGYLQFKIPHDLASCTAVMTIGDNNPSTAPLLLTTENGGLTIDATAHTITCFISDANTALISWDRGEYQLKLIDSAGIVTALDPDIVLVQKAVAT